MLIFVELKGGSNTIKEVKVEGKTSKSRYKKAQPKLSFK